MAAPTERSESAELDAFEAFIASNPEELNSILEKPFGSLLDHVNGLGFDGHLIFQELQNEECFSREVWVDSVGIESLEHFLQLTPIQYSDLYPLVGAPLVVGVVNSIRVSEEQHQLLTQAGGSKLSPAAKWTLIGGGAVTMLYLAPRLIKHQVTKNAIREALSEENLQLISSGEEIKFTNEIGSTVYKEGITGKSLEIKFNKWSERISYELRSTSPYLIYKWLTNKENSAASGDIKKVAEIDAKTKLDDSIRTIDDDDPYADEVFMREVRGFEIRPVNTVENFRNLIRSSGEGASLLQSITSVTDPSNLMNRDIDSFVSNQFNQQITGLENSASRIEQEEFDLMSRELDSELGVLSGQVDTYANNQISKGEQYLDNELITEIDSGEQIVETKEQSAIDKLE